MQVDINDEMMDNLLRKAITGTGVPFTYIDATNDVEFARSLSMQNQGFVKKVVGYQEVFGTYFTEIIRDMYVYEFGRTEHDISRDKRIAKTGRDDGINESSLEVIHPENIIIKFPDPVLLNVNNNNEQIEATTTTIDYITSLYFSEDQDEEEIRVFKKHLAKDVFLRNMDWDLYDEAFKNSKRVTKQ